MAVELGDDPFRGSSVLSLLPRTLGGGAEPAAAVAEELGSVEAFLKSMTLQGSKELLEQAQAIAQSSLHITNLVLKDGDGLMVANGKDCPQGRRPALGRKRARFSLKPDSTQSLAGVNVNSTVDGIEDPEEYFLACENLENAGKELKKLKREISAELLPHHQSTAARKHRPGILGKMPMYKHHFPAVDSAEGIVVSQDETPDRRNPILSHTSMDVYASNLLHPKAINRPQNSEARETNITELFDANDVEGSISQEEKKIDDLYYSLLSQEDLDGEKGQAFLRESLQIQQIDIGKMRLPGLFGSLKDDAMTLNSISGNKKWEKLQLSQPSPTLPKSPLAAIFALQRRLSLKNPLKEQYSLYPSDEVSCPGESSLIGRKDEHLTSPLADIDHHDTSGVIADGASPASTCEKTLSLADKMHLSILKSDKTVGKMIASWKSQKLCSLKDSLKDQYPAHPSDDMPCLKDSPQRGYQDDYPISPSVVVKDCDPSISISNGASTLARMSEKSLNLEGMASHKVTSNLQPMEHFPCLLERDVSCDSSRFDNDNNTISVGFDGCLEEEDNDMQPNALTFGWPEHAPEDQTLKEQLTGNFTCSLGREKNYNLRISGSNKDAVSMEPDSSQEGDNIELDAAASAQEEPGLKDLSPRFVNPKVKEGSASDAAASAFGNDATGHKDLSLGSVTNASGNHDTMGGKVNDAVQAEQRSKDAEAVGGLISVKANTSQAVPSVDGHLESTHVTLEENNVRGLQADSATPSKRRTKQRAPLQTQSKRNSASERRNLANSEMSPRKGTGQKTSPCGRKNKKSIAKRQSLAGAGTMWQFGVRRSTRIKSRPLEYWRGERFLYGRIHDSLATVIGIKYASPSNSKLKVKSYVSEEYANLVAQAALG